MSAIDIFTYSGQQVRTTLIDGEPWFVLSDLCAALEIVNVSNVAARLDPAGLNTLRLTGGIRGNPNVTIVNEGNMFEVVIRSDKPEAVVFRRWITGTVLPEIRRTGSFGSPAPVEVSRRDLALAVLAAEDEADRQRVRADKAEEFKGAIERSIGLVPRAFHKHYFPSAPERQFFELLYERGLIIDQRGKGARRDDGSYRDGAQHGHPSYEGKKFFYLDTGVNEKTGYRFEQVHVIPGDPEVALVAYLTRHGLTPLVQSKELAHV